VALATAEVARDRREAERAQDAGSGEGGEPEVVEPEVEAAQGRKGRAAKGAKRSPADAHETEPTGGDEAGMPAASPRKRKARQTA